MKPEVTYRGALDMQVCVPKKWKNKEVVEFANTQYLCGTQNGWFIRKQGDEALSGDDERVSCNERKGFVHIMLDA